MPAFLVSPRRQPRPPRLIRHSLAGCLLAAPVLALSQHIPDAGSTLRQTEQERQPVLPPATRPAAPPITAPAAPPADAPGAPQATPSRGPTLVLSRVQFEGNTLLTQEVLAASVAAYLQRPVALADLEVAAALVAQRYREEGWLARVTIPPQEVAQGVLTFQVIEASYGGARFTEDTDKAGLPVPDDAIVRRVEARQARGEKLHLPSIERGLLVAGDMPGVAVAGSQVAGSREGETDVMLKASSKGRVYGELGADNYGARATGNERVQGRIGLNSPLGMGDQFDLQTQFTRHLRYARLAGSVPLGSDGLRLGANASALHYEIGTPQFRALEPRGNSRLASVELLYPLIRATDRNLYLALSHERKYPYNTTVTGVTSDYSIANTVLRLDANRFDALWGGAVNIASLGLTSGKVDLDGSPTQAGDAATVNTQGHFNVLHYRFGRDQQINRQWSVYGTFTGQLASKNLDSAEKFYLGGPQGVRAYPLNEGGGSQGRMLNLELRWRTRTASGWTTTLAGFYDWGRVDVNKRNSFAGAPALNSYSLSGYGLAVTATGPSGISLVATWARRIGDNPNPTLGGTDQDGSLHKNRFWLSAAKSF